MFGILILAGGTGKRLGQDKALLSLWGKPLILHVIERILGLTTDIVVVIGKYAKFGNYSFLPSTVTLLKDRVANMGPLAGMLIGMKSMNLKYVVVLPCDSPFIKKEVLIYLARKAKGFDAVIPRWPNGYIEPLHAIYSVEPTVKAVEDALKQRKLFVSDVITQLSNVIYVEINNLRNIDQKLTTFININTQKDLRKVEKSRIF